MKHQLLAFLCAMTMSGLVAQPERVELQSADGTKTIEVEPAVAQLSPRLRPQVDNSNDEKVTITLPASNAAILRAVADLLNDVYKFQQGKLIESDSIVRLAPRIQDALRSAGGDRAALIGAIDALEIPLLRQALAKTIGQHLAEYAVTVKTRSGGAQVVTSDAFNWDLLPKDMTDRIAYYAASTIKSPELAKQLFESLAVTRLSRHSAPITALALSLDDMRLASGSADGVVHVWDIRDIMNPGQLYTIMPGPVKKIVFSPNGATLATLTNNDQVQIWSAINGQLQHSLTKHGKVADILYSPESTSLTVFYPTNKMRVADVATGRLAKPIQTMGMPAQQSQTEAVAHNAGNLFFVQADGPAIVIYQASNSLEHIQNTVGSVAAIIQAALKEQQRRRGAPAQDLEDGEVSGWEMM